MTIAVYNCICLIHVMYMLCTFTRHLCMCDSYIVVVLYSLVWCRWHAYTLAYSIGCTLFSAQGCLLLGNVLNAPCSYCSSKQTVFIKILADTPNELLCFITWGVNKDFETFNKNKNKSSSTAVAEGWGLARFSIPCRRLSPSAQDLSRLVPTE